MLLNVNQIVFGLGRGVLGSSPNGMGVWAQGCSLRKCPGCTSTHTWSKRAGKTVSVAALLRLADKQANPPSRLTISGGEPTDQADAVTALIEGFRTAFPAGEIVLFTGLGWPVFAARFEPLAARLDVVVAGPFIRALRATPLAGSSNQEVRLLTPLAERLYRDWRDWPLHALQVGQTSAGRLVTVGIPDARRLARAAAQINAVDVTWDRRISANERNRA